MEVKIISRENVRPSYPTPPHLRKFKLSLLDQLLPTPYAPILLFYDSCDSIPDDVPRRLEKLKQSLSQTLTHFYPLAGKIRDGLVIDCDDGGAYYVETRVNCRLSEFLRQADLMLLHQFFPCQVLIENDSMMAGLFVANFQVNVFECGGIALGVCISHTILDGAALSTFLKAWSDIARGRNEAVVYPELNCSALFPANDLWLRESSIVMFGSFFKEGKAITKRFVFDASGIAALKAQVVSSGQKCPTRIEAVSSFLWKCTMAVSEELHGYRRPSLLTHLVNLRKKAAPLLPENSIGNLMWFAAAKHKAESTAELNDLVGEVREAISKVDADLVKQMKGDKGNSVMSDFLKETGEYASDEEVDYLGFSSWCKFGFYGVDFGWGKPVWVSSVGLSAPVVMNLIILVDTRDDSGIEAWVTLDEEVMNIVETNPELLKFASLNPSPLEINLLSQYPCT